MSVATIRIELDEQVAQIYTTASAEKRRKIQALLSLWLKAFAETDISLESFMDDMSDRARQRGLTPEILDRLLADE